MDEEKTPAELAINIIAFLYSCIRSGEQLSLEEDKFVEEVIEKLRNVK